MRYTKKVIKTSGGLVVRVPADIVRLLNLTDKDYVEIDLTKIDVKELNKSIGIICFDENLLEQIDTLITIMGVNGERYIKLDSKKKISYIPKGIYLTNHENCKGLEFSKVYVLGLDPSKISQFNEAKKAFVAVTRAMNELHIYHY